MRDLTIWHYTGGTRPVEMEQGRVSRVVSFEMAERVGFVPEVPAPLNDLARIGTARTRQNL